MSKLSVGAKKLTGKASTLTKKITKNIHKTLDKPNRANESSNDTSLKDIRFRQNKNKNRIIVASIVVLIAVMLFFIFKAIFASEETMESQLENYATEIYEKELKNRESNSYTLNLQYIERQGYNVSSYIDKNCNKTGTYVIVNVDKDKNITSVTSQLDCGED